MANNFQLLEQRLTNLVVIFAIILGFTMSCTQYQSYTDTIEVNGTSIFYAAEGCGKPIILLHGNGGSHNDLETMQRQLAQAGYQVYALDSRGQGANAPLPEYHYKDMANDVWAFIKAKSLEHPAVYGWSDGGIVALELESMHPGTCSLLAVSGANVTPGETSLSHETFEMIFGEHLRSDHIPPLVKMMLDEPNMSADDLRRIRIPVLVCAGDRDLILPSHTHMMAETLPCGEECIVPDADHGSYIWHNPRMGEILLDYLKKNGY